MKSPAFQLYAADFYMDTASWPVDEVGMYTRLLFYQWVNGSIPNDIEKIARISGCISGRKWSANVARMWSNMRHKFATLPDGNLINLRLEESRKKQEKFSESQRERANKRWKDDYAGALPGHMPKPCSSSSSSKDITPIVPKKGTTYTEDFLYFWNAYPKKVGRDAAWKKWKSMNGTRPKIEELLTAIKKQEKSEQWKKENGQYIPNPSTWLNQGRWADEVETPKPKGSW
jgi:uncharacterized protein YdaU (DUF1376 family)